MNLGLQMPKTKLAPTYVEHEAAELLSILLVDVASDIEVAARDAGISDASFIRCRRALDRLSCAQSILEAMRAESAEAKSDEAALRMREAVELLAKEWPEDYPAGAVEWLLLQPCGAKRAL
ncbi:hypothetical protein [Paraburkholderia bryophila]|uniref:Uncharacterized protein n=1 Tax=Paraburkholderia bryophila TaxID=420952 RepID=A0A7Y9WS05_9BURK|nr:hypothetical protein [Paraburkholderia bryophila]NYH26007.1 hypothetical protein [Paraburkholderia bryophila]